MGQIRVQFPAVLFYNYKLKNLKFKYNDKADNYLNGFYIMLAKLY